jgi:hypothetical protein
VFSVSLLFSFNGSIAIDLFGVIVRMIRAMSFVPSSSGDEIRSCCGRLPCQQKEPGVMGDPALFVTLGADWVQSSPKAA